MSTIYFLPDYLPDKTLQMFRLLAVNSPVVDGCECKGVTVRTRGHKPHVIVRRDEMGR